MLKPKVIKREGIKTNLIAPVNMKLIFKPQSTEAKQIFLDEIMTDITDLIGEALYPAGVANGIQISGDDSGEGWISWTVSLSP